MSRNMTPYQHLLRDPRWQKRRLEILERDGWQCQQCGSVDRELQVHHRWYAHGAAPWESPDQALLTLCCVCHQESSMPQEIMTVNGPLEPPPSLSELVHSAVGEADIRIARGSNGFWYVCIEDLEAISERLCAERFQAMKRFHSFCTYNDRGREARAAWDTRLGAGRAQHVHFTTTQVGYDGTWSIYDLGQAYAAWVDPWFEMRIQEVYRQVTTGIYHADEQQPHPVGPSRPAQPLSTTNVREIGLALVAIADRQDAVEVKVHKVTHEVHEVRAELGVVSQRVDGLEQRQSPVPVPPHDWLTASLFLEKQKVRLPTKEFRTFTAFVREAMGIRTPFLWPRPGKAQPDYYYPPDALDRGWQVYQQHHPRLF